MDDNSLSDDVVSWTDRLAAVVCYLVPALWNHLTFARRSEFVRHHSRQALLLSFFLVSFVGLAAALFLISSWLHVQWEEHVIAWRVGDVFGWTLVFLLLLWLAGWFTSVTLAAVGSRRPLLLRSRMKNRPWVNRVGLIGDSGLWLTAILLSAVGVYAARVARQIDGKPAPLYILYDDAQAPRWVVALVTAPTLLAAERRWGNGAAIIAPLMPASLREALAHGRLVYVAAHGYSGPALYRDSELGPQDVAQSMPIGSDLQLVYLSQCHGGDMAKEWEAALAPATVISYPRFSAHLEHAYFLWWQAPRFIKRQ